MAGIYIHIPFCKQACHYCNFHFSTSLKLQNAFTEALLKEIGLRREYLSGAEVNTIYFGGGTPSLMPINDLYAILSALKQHFSIDPRAEITLETNPDDLHNTSLTSWRQLGFNRLSIGIQSFFEEDLLWMNRAHNAIQAKNCIPMAQAAGFDNMSIDLIYGGPTLTDERWLENLDTAINHGVPHLSCYALTVEPGTALDVLTKKKKVATVESEHQARQFMLMSDYLQEKGYEHYEISNLSLPGKRSRHNSAYWGGSAYLGLGPSAHSYNGHSRQWNVANNSIYIQSINKSTVPFEIEELTPVQQLNEYLMTSLRTSEGTDLEQISKRFGSKEVEILLQRAAPPISRGWIQLEVNRLVLTREGKLFADGIAAELFADDNHTSTASIALKPARG